MLSWHFLFISGDQNEHTVTGLCQVISSLRFGVYLGGGCGLLMTVLELCLPIIQVCLATLSHSLVVSFISGVYNIGTNFSPWFGVHPIQCQITSIV